MKIRFLTLTPQQFAEGPATSSLLTQAEKFAILMNISSPSTDVPMPVGFTGNTTSRQKLPIRTYDEVFGVSIRANAFKLLLCFVEILFEAVKFQAFVLLLCCENSCFSFIVL